MIFKDNCTLSHQLLYTLLPWMHERFIWPPKFTSKKLNYEKASHSYKNPESCSHKKTKLIPSSKQNLLTTLRRNKYCNMDIYWNFLDSCCLSGIMFLPFCVVHLAFREISKKNSSVFQKIHLCERKFLPKIPLYKL